MTSKTKALIAGAIAVLFAASLIVWQVRTSRAESLELSADDMSKIAESLAPQMQMQLSTSEEARKAFAEDLRKQLAVAQEAKAKGVADRPEVKQQLELMRSFVLARAYATQQMKNSGVTSVEQLIPQSEVEAYLKEPGQEQKFDQVLKGLQAQGAAAAPPEGEQRKEMQQQWARIMVGARKGAAAGLDKDRKTQLQLMMQEVNALINVYAQELSTKAKASDAEVNAYLTKHPELDPQKARERADEVLKRVRAGEDFGKLAEEFSADTMSKVKGGDLGWVTKGQTVKPFEDAVFSLQPGQVSEIVETQFGYHIIKAEEKREGKGEDGKPAEEVHARHILISTQGGQPANPFAPPQSPLEQARAAVEREKFEKIVEEIEKRSRVRVADNFSVSKPEFPAMNRPPVPVPEGPEDEAEPVTAEKPAAGKAAPEKKGATTPKN